MKSKLILLAVLVFCGLCSPWIGKINAYYYDILIGVGINVILAAGLNLVNGYTGQFSLGHAGFMAVGAYAASWLTLRFGYSMGSSEFSTTTMYFLALLAGGVGAALATGGVVGAIPFKASQAFAQQSWDEEYDVVKPPAGSSIESGL